MKSLTAGDALSDRVMHVTADMHPSPGKCNGDRENVYVVFHEGCDASPGQGFLGLVDGRQAVLFPNRIFADLLLPWQAGHVKMETPLEDVQQQLLEGSLYCLPVVDDRGDFLGAVTRDSVLRILFDREQQMFLILKQGVELQEQQHSLIAFEIHDGLIQYLTAARMHLQSAAERLEEMPPEAAVQFDRTMALLQEGIDEARCLIRGLRPPILEDLGLVPAIESLVEQQTSNCREIEFVYGEASRHLSRFQETSLFRIVQEALTNAVRHSGAKRIRIAISQQAGQLCLEVRDWGRGFDIHAPSDGYGLKGIRYRTRALQGQAEITSSPGEGTQFTVRFPMVQ
ncbi:MAG: ATP-binding protein [Thermoguttaceae bacterium]|jgi:signal transduction histidine kinase